MSKHNNHKTDENGNKFLFYHCGKPVYENDETHTFLTKVAKESGGDMIKHVRKEIKNFKNLGGDKLFNK